MTKEQDQHNTDNDVKSFNWDDIELPVTMRNK